jgi:hypothetical protein
LSIDFDVWQRLEPIINKKKDTFTDIDVAIHDPAWMLARQWQIGEFEGEDAASPVKINLKTRQNKISKIVFTNHNTAGNGNDIASFINYNENLPLEVYVERVYPNVFPREDKLDLQTRVRIGVQFQRELNSVIRNTEPTIPTNVIANFKNFLTSESVSNVSPSLAFNETLEGNESDITKSYLNVINGKVIDIYQLFENPDAIVILESKVNEYFASYPQDAQYSGIIDNALKAAFQNLKQWWNVKYFPNQNDSTGEESFIEIPSNNNNIINNDINFSAWDPRHLEYNFKLQIGSNDNNKLILEASEYKEDHLDWYSFTIDQNGSSDQFSLEDPPKEVIDIYPTNLRYPGSPVKRWWNFEDYYINLGDISSQINDIVTPIIREFALVHSTDWYMIPFTMELGTIVQIESLIVTDCFGDNTTIEPAGRTKKEFSISEANKWWDSWDIFSISWKYNKINQQKNSPYFFLPPTIDNAITSPPIEEIRFTRDEMANSVWAIERTFRTSLGEPISGYDYYLSLYKKAAKIDMANNNLNQQLLKYILMTAIPWNWIPFIPVRINNNSVLNNVNFDLYGQIQLQRGLMIDPTTIPSKPIIPHSRILTEVQSPYYIDESEIPRTGVIVTERFQRTVWSNGLTFLWIGRNKVIGSGESLSGLKFDTILNK